MTARDTYNASVASAHVSAEDGSSITYADGVVDGRLAARTALQNGAITFATFVARMHRINVWEQTQRDNARDVLRSTGDFGPS
jgi:hypothetical protein